MALSCGIVGLPNVGKSSIFNALTSLSVPATNFPFCTIDPNTGVVPVPDERLAQIAARVTTAKVTPATVTFVDIAGLVKGASHGEGLGNQFLGHIKNAAAVIHVVRCFDDPNVAHIDAVIDPVRDIEIVETELMLADMATVTRRHEAAVKAAKSHPKDHHELDVLERVKAALEAGRPARSLGLSEEDGRVLADMFLLTMKPMIYAANIPEADINQLNANAHFAALQAHAQVCGIDVVAISGKVEADLAALSDNEREAFRASLGLSDTSLERLIHAAYRLLSLITFYTVNKNELRAWDIIRGSHVIQAAECVHTDMAKGFIKAEVYHADDLITFGSEHEIRAKGHLRAAGKDHVVADGEVLFFHFR